MVDSSKLLASLNTSGTLNEIIFLEPSIKSEKESSVGVDLFISIDSTRLNNFMLLRSKLFSSLMMDSYEKTSKNCYSNDSNFRFAYL